MRLNGIIRACLLVLVLPCIGWSIAPNLTVTVKDSNGAVIVGADVAAISFSSMGPVASSLISTDGSGNAALTLTAGLMYQVIATTAGYVPSARDQMFDWTSSVFAQATNTPKTITLRRATSADKARDISVTVTHDATAGNLLFLNLSNKNTYEPAGMGFLKSTGAGSQIGYIYGAPTSDQDYPFQLDVFNPETHRGDRISVDNKTGAGTNDVGTLDIRASAGAMGPPTKQIASDETLGEIVFEGKVTKSEDGSGIAGVNINLNGDNGTVNFQAQSDDSGYFCFYQTNDSSAVPMIKAGHQYNLNFNVQGRVGAWRMYTVTATSGKINKTTVQLAMDQATGKIKGNIFVVSNGVHIPIPQAGINAWSDWNNYASAGPADQKPGFGNSSCQVEKGSFTLEGLPSGRYMINVWSEFNNQPINYNNGPDMESANLNNGQPVSDWKDDYIVEIDTTVSDYAKVYNAKAPNATVVSAGNNIVINIVKNPDGANTITGRITFIGTAPDPASVLLVARENWTTDGTQPKSGFTVLQAADQVSANVYSFTITGLADATYQLEVKAPNFGIKYDNNDQRPNENIVLGNGRTTAAVNLTMAPAGVIEGVLRTPKGTIFVPSDMNMTNAQVNAQGDETNCWGGGQLDKYGKFRIEGLLPGKYQLQVNGQGTTYNYATATLDNINVNVNQVTTIEVPLHAGVRVCPVLSHALPASITGNIGDRKGNLQVVYTPANVALTAKNIDEIFHVGKGGDNSNTINFWGGQWQNASLEPGSYNFYLLFQKEFPANSEHYSQVVLGRLKNVVVEKSKETDSYYTMGSTINVQNLSIAVSVGNAQFSGTYAGNNTLRDADIAVIAQNFSTFISYVPRVTLIGSDGNILATGMCTPTVQVISQLGLDNGNLPADALTQLQNYMRSMTFGIDYLVPQEDIKAVVITPNYPPLLKTVNVPGTMSVDMDTDAGEGANITGFVKDAHGQPIPGATVRIRGRLLDRAVKSQIDGSYLIPGLATGGYRLLVNADGFALAADKVIIGNENKVSSFALTSCSCTITGTVCSQRFPYPLVVAGAKIVAYDDTANGLHPTAELPIYETVTENDGTYSIAPVIEGHTYKVALVVPGKAVQIQSAAVPGAPGSILSGIDFTYKSVPPKVDIIVRPDKNGTGVVLVGESPKKLVSLKAKYCVGTTYTDGSATVVTPSAIGDKTYSISLPDKTKSYAIRFTADDGATVGTLDVTYNPNNLAQVVANIEQEIVSSGDVLLDSQGNDISGLYIAPGSITLGDNSMPSVTIDKENRTASTYAQSMGAGTAAGDVYHLDVSLDGSAQNDTKTLTLTIGYDPSLVSGNADGLGIFQYNAATGAWDPIVGSAMVDPISNTVSMEVQSITNAAADSAGASAPSKLTRAVFNGKEYKLAQGRAPATSDQSGIFMVGKKSVSGESYAGGTLEVFNVPNPFSLKTKTVTLLHGGSASQMTTKGTLIRFSVPSSYGTNVKAKFRIYNISGELVREIDANDVITGGVIGGFYYYLDWDGTNKDGKSCASGVYLCVAEVGTEKKVIKMALIK